MPEFGEIQFHIHVKGAEKWSWTDIVNNGSVTNPSVNPHNGNARSLGVLMPTADHVYLQWLYDRMIKVHGENELYDYMHRFKQIIDDLKEKDNSQLQGSEILYGFLSWLTTRDEAITFSSKHDTNKAIKLLMLFLKYNKLSEPRKDWVKNLEHPPC